MCLASGGGLLTAGIFTFPHVEWTQVLQFRIKTLSFKFWVTSFKFWVKKEGEVSIIANWWLGISLKYFTQIAKFGNMLNLKLFIFCFDQCFPVKLFLSEKSAQNSSASMQLQ